jgi:hypothetical protein
MLGDIKKGERWEGEGSLKKLELEVSWELGMLELPG